MLRKISPLLALGVFVLMMLGCVTAVSTPSPTNTPVPTETPWACTSPGTEEVVTIDETSEGYSYQFRIYLPPCYETDTDMAYPVIYLLPGRGGGPGNWFAAGAVEVADELILQSEIPPFIMVAAQGIEFDPTGDLIFEELVPFVSQQYRVLPTREHHAVAGASLGGVGAYRLLFQHTDYFSTAGLFGSGLIHGEEAQMDAWITAVPDDQPVRLFFNTGEGDPLMLDRARVLTAVLDDADIDYQMIVSDGAHTMDYWVSNFAEYVHWLAEEW